MSQIETLARQAWQLRQQGYSFDDIADAIGKPTSAIERWLKNWARMARSTPPWYEGIDIRTVACLRHAVIDCRASVLKAWEQGDIKRGSPQGIGLSRLMEIRCWLETEVGKVAPVPPKAINVDLSPETEAALRRIKRREGVSASQLISELLVKVDFDNGGG